MFSNYTLKERIQYWVDRKLETGTKVIGILLFLGIFIFLFITSTITAHLFKDDKVSYIWNNVVALVNQWMPEYEEEMPVLIIIIRTISAVIGLLFASILIGWISEVIQTKIERLKQGNARIIESNHIVILGYEYGECQLISELINAYGNQRISMVVADDKDKMQMEEDISRNIIIPKNVNIICRTIDIFDPAALRCCSIENSKAVIILPKNDCNTMKTHLAVASLLKTADDSSAKIVSAVYNDKFILPFNRLKKKAIMLQVNNIISKLIANSCVQHGIANILCEVIGFEGSELYVNKLHFEYEMGFSELVFCMEKGTPIGILRNNKYLIEIDGNAKIENNDKILYFAENREEYSLDYSVLDEFNKNDICLYRQKNIEKRKVLILGYNENLTDVISNFPFEIISIVIAGIDLQCKDYCVSMFKKLGIINYSLLLQDIDRSELEILVSDIDYVIILSNYNNSEDAEDTNNMLLYLHLRDIRRNKGYRYNIIAEMKKDKNRQLINLDDNNDLIVASNISSMCLAQMAVNPELRPIFDSILSYGGLEIRIIKPVDIGLKYGKIKVRYLRVAVLNIGYKLIGYVKYNNDCIKKHLNPNGNEVIDLDESVNLVVIVSDTKKIETDDVNAF